MGRGIEGLEREVMGCTEGGDRKWRASRKEGGSRDLGKVEKTI